LQHFREDFLPHPNSLANLKKGHDWTKRRPAVKVNALSFGLMLQYLMEHPNTGIQELADHAGLHYMTVGLWMRSWHTIGLIHLSGWDKDTYGRPNIRLFTFGPGQDAKRPRKSGAEIARDYRAKKKARALQDVWVRKKVLDKPIAGG
jgi:hypothetical protein